MYLLMAPNALDLLGTSRSCECCWGPSRAWPLSPSRYRRQRVADNRIWRSQRRTWWCRCWCRDAWPSRSATRAHGYVELQRGSPLRGWKYRTSWRISTRMMKIQENPFRHFSNCACTYAIVWIWHCVEWSHAQRILVQDVKVGSVLEKTTWLLWVGHCYGDKLIKFKPFHGRACPRTSRWWSTSPRRPSSECQPHSAFSLLRCIRVSSCKCIDF